MDSSSKSTAKNIFSGITPICSSLYSYMPQYNDKESCLLTFCKQLMVAVAAMYFVSMIIGAVIAVAKTALVLAVCAGVCYLLKLLTNTKAQTQLPGLSI